MKKGIQLMIIALLTFTFFGCTVEESIINQPPETLTDVDGNVYRTITIGNQIWMLENLKTTKFNDGTAITEYLSGEHWNKENRTFPFYQWASTDDLNNVIDGDLPEDYYGMMYNHAAIESGKLAPEGWRIPTEEDWRTLKNYIANDGHLGSESSALKSSTGWADHSGNGIDAYEFKGLPNGYVDSNGTPKANTLICTWATSDHNSAQFTRKVINLFDQSEILFLDQSILLGAGVRCIKE